MKPHASTTNTAGLLGHLYSPVHTPEVYIDPNTATGNGTNQNCVIH